MKMHMLETQCQITFQFLLGFHIASPAKRPCHLYVLLIVSNFLRLLLCLYFVLGYLLHSLSFNDSLSPDNSQVSGEKYDEGE